ncbi:hypothetical protein WA538_002637 [Blastocystis sp. DL]
MEAENTNPAPIEVIGPVVEESKKEEVNASPSATIEVSTEEVANKEEEKKEESAPETVPTTVSAEAVEEEKSAEVKETETTATPEVNPVVVEVKEEEVKTEEVKVEEEKVEEAPQEEVKADEVKAEEAKTEEAPQEEVKEEEAAPQVEKVDAVQVEGAQTDATQPEQTAQKPDEETWKMIGNVCLTPCGHGVISSRTDDNRAAVILIAAEGKDIQTRLATGVFSISSLRKPTLEKVPTSLTILRAQVYRDLGDTLVSGEVFDKALFLYQTAINLVSDDIEEEYRTDAIVIIVTALTSMSNCFLSMNKLEQAETMAKQAYSISPKYDKAAIAMATVYVAKSQYKEALDALQPAIEANPDEDGLKVIHNKIVEMLNEQLKTTAQQRAASSVLLNNFAGAKKEEKKEEKKEVSQMELMKEALEKMQAEQNKPKTPEELQKEKEAEEKAAKEARQNSILWGTIGGVALAALVLFKVLHRNFRNYMERADVEVFLDLDQEQTEAERNENAARHEVEHLVDRHNHQRQHLLEAIRQLPSAQVRDVDSD